MVGVGRPTGGDTHTTLALYIDMQRPLYARSLSSHGETDDNSFLTRLDFASCLLGLLVAAISSRGSGL